jgi:hypothetical protein
MMMMMMIVFLVSRACCSFISGCPHLGAKYFLHLHFYPEYVGNLFLSGVGTYLPDKVQKIII